MVITIRKITVSITSEVVDHSQAPLYSSPIGYETIFLPSAKIVKSL